MKQFFFGPPQQPIFGFLHRPQPGKELGQGIVVAPPFSNEYFRSFRCLKVLSDRLAKLGYAVLRFDFYGTGDSGGEDIDMNLDRWLDDVRQATAFLREQTGVEQVHLLGRRLGAAFCLQAAAEGGVERLVAWDPVIRGGDYLREIRADHEDFVGVNRRTVRVIREINDPRYRMEVLGQCLPHAFVDGLEALDLRQGIALEGVEVLFIDSSENGSRRTDADALTALGAKVEFHQIHDRQFKDPNNPISVYIPNKITRTITGWFTPAKEPTS